MPRKVFTAGEVLAASDVNDFLMDQTVMSFAGTAARGSAITTPVEGMVTYLEDSQSLSVNNGTDWTIDRTIQVFADSTARGSAIGTAVEGMYSHLNDTDELQYYDGSAWVPILSAGSGIAFTPTWTNLTVGNGVYNRSHYTITGKTAILAIDFSFGSTTAVTGNLVLELPAELTFAASTKTGVVEGSFLDSNTNARYLAMNRQATTNEIVIRSTVVSGTRIVEASISSTTPFTWTTDDRILIGATFEVA
jgi:hypothetical protein